MDTVCLAFLATLIQSGSGLDVLLQTHAQECIRVVTKMLKIRDGALDEKSGGKVKTAVGVTAN